MMQFNIPKWIFLECDENFKPIISEKGFNFHCPKCTSPKTIRARALESFRGGFLIHRKELADKLADPDILKCARIAHNLQEEIQLLEAGFDYIKDTANGGSLWRKRSI